jgi:hypothetical protein
MIQAEIERRFGLAVEGFQKALAGKGSDGFYREFCVDRVNPNRIQRTLEGAMARCRYVPHVSVSLKDGWRFDPAIYATRDYCKDGSYCEFDYLGIDNECLVVVDYRWGDTIDISVRAFPLKVISSIYVGYEAMLFTYSNERAFWSGNLPAIVSPVTSERRVMQ